MTQARNKYKKGNSALSIIYAVQMISSLIVREEKIKWLIMVGLAIVVSIFELITASTIVIFAQVLNEPTSGKKLLASIGIASNLSTSGIVLVVTICVAVTYIIKNSIAAFEVFFQNFSIQEMSYNFKNKLLQHYAQADYGIHLTRNSSFGLQLVASDTERAFSSGMVSLANVISESVVFIFLVSMIIYLNPMLALIIFAVSIVFGLCVSKFLLPKFYSWGLKLQETEILTTQNLMQFFHATKEIVLLGKSSAFVQAYKVHSKQRTKILAIQTTANALPRIFIEIFFVGIFVLTISYLCMKHQSPMQMLGLLSGYLYAGFRLMPGLNRIINQLNTLNSVIPSIERIHKEYTTITTTTNYIEVLGFEFDRQIMLENIYFKYLNTDQYVLSCVSLTITKGECIGIIGETGSGKSTLIDLILGLLKPDVGSILIDNKYPANASQWHQRIGYVPQSIYLLDDSIEANIAFGEENINDDKLTKAIEAAQLSGFISGLKDGSKTIVGERGIRLSGGERQRIAIARALYNEPEVLIFDEATSALDSETESRLMDTIEKLRRKRTFIMIAHRLTTLRGCDRIVQMENGSIKKIMNYTDMGEFNYSDVQNIKNT